MKRLLIAALLLLGSASFAHAQQPAAPHAQAVKQYIYVLRPIPRLQEQKNWTAQDNAAVRAHFERLKRLTAEGTVILAGRTQTLDASTFGIVIFEASSPEAARDLMEEDPAVKQGIMTAELFPYSVALMRETPKP